MLTGCSAGGLSTILRCDDFKSLFPLSTKVKCMRDAGFFLDTWVFFSPILLCAIDDETFCIYWHGCLICNWSVDISGGRTLRRMYSGVVNTQVRAFNVIIMYLWWYIDHRRAKANQVFYWIFRVCKTRFRTCTNHLDPTSVSISRCSLYVFLCNKAMISSWSFGNLVSIFQCFFPQNIISQVMTPLYILNSAFDSWQVIFITPSFSSFSFSLYVNHVAFSCQEHHHWL